MTRKIPIDSLVSRMEFCLRANNMDSVGGRGTLCTCTRSRYTYNKQQTRVFNLRLPFLEMSHNGL